jgi:type II secretory pathway pseudopilin PulG
MNKKGFSLIEIIIYLGIISIIAITFFRILGVSTRIQVSQVAANEVANQTNFVMQTIQRLVRESSAVMVSSANPCTSTSDNVNDDGALLGTDQTCLKLRMKDSKDNPDTVGARDPIFIWKDSASGVIKMQEGLDTEVKVSDLTTGKVLDVDNALVFRKYTNYPGHDTIEISLTLNYNSENQQAQVQRVAKTAISRVSAATFDSSLLPSGTFGSDIGNLTQRWANAFIGNLDVSGTITQTGNFDNQNNRGLMVVGVRPTPETNCTAVCTNQSLTCFKGYNFTPITPLPPQIGMVATTCSTNLTDGGLCFCY